MSSWQRVLFALTVVCAVVLLGPAAALANGPSAGDQQYVDPLSGSHHHSKSNTSSGSSTTAPSTATPTTSTPAPTTVTPTTSTTATSASSTPSTTTSSSGSHDPSGKSLPFTGFDVWLAVALGLGLLTTGVYLRRLSSRA